MGLGILEDAHLKHVPGTATLEELDGRHTITDDHVKRTKDGIILVPQPSDDPEDPLNWPLWQRDLATFLLCMLSVMASTLSPLMAANTLTMIQWYGGISPTDAALLTGWHLFGVGISGFIFVAMARVWGKRHLFILAPLIIIASCAWAGCSGHNYKSLVAARFFQGVGLAPFEGLVNAAVGEIYFVHESGKRLALTNLCLFGGAFFTPVIVGITTLRIGWQWTFWLVSIFTAALLPFVYVYCPETSFVRHTHTADSNENLVPAHASEVKPWEGRARPISSASGKSNKTEFMDSFEQVEIAERTSSYNVTTSNIHEPVQRKLVTRRSLRIFSGRKTQEPFWKLCLRPFALFLYPSVLWAVLVQGALICWVSIMGVSLAIVMIGLQFNEAETGYMYGGAFVGALGAFVLAGLISDPTARFMTRRNGGVFEPEFRMVLVLPMAALGLAGLFGFGIVGANIKEYGWLPLDVMFGLVVGGMTLGAVVSAQYVVDAHRDIAVEGFTCMLVFKNMIAFMICYLGLDWLFAVGTRDMFFTLGYVQLAICASTIPMYVFGKRNRSLVARYDILRMLRLK